jgi:hypothetical protein
MVAASTLRRFGTVEAHGNRVTLSALHPAYRTGRSLFPSRVFDPDEVQRVLKDGHQSRKIGKFVTKGKLRDFPIFTLTLEERATCPRSCLQWAHCFGNNMQAAERIVAGEELEAALWHELADLQAKHPDGFLVRLHVLGDFYSVRYAELWYEALEAYPALHIFGYTAREPTSEIGQLICEMIGVWPTRFHVRFSGWNGPRNGSVVVDSAEATEHVVCPAQTGKTDCCATCALCWHSDRTIAFLRH